jgi:hypothetical protein
METNGIYEMVRNCIKNVDNCRIAAEAPLDERGLRSARKVSFPCRPAGVAKGQGDVQGGACAGQAAEGDPATERLDPVLEPEPGPTRDRSPRRSARRREP